MAAEEGFEPSQTESESGVLPLHNSAKRKSYYTYFYAFVKRLFYSSRSFFTSAWRALARWLMAFFSSGLSWALVQPRSGR